MTGSRGMPAFRGLSHLTPDGEARMVDVSAKAETVREARARVTVKMKLRRPITEVASEVQRTATA